MDSTHAATNQLMFQIVDKFGVGELDTAELMRWGKDMGDALDALSGIKPEQVARKLGDILHDCDGRTFKVGEQAVTLIRNGSDYVLETETSHEG